MGLTLAAPADPGVRGSLYVEVEVAWGERPKISYQALAEQTLERGNCNELLPRIPEVMT